MSTDDSRPAPDWRIGERYQIEERIGSGAYGIVYRATDVLDGREVAVKLFNADGDAFAPRSWREAAVLRRINLPGVVRLLDEGRDDGCPYLVMPFIDGRHFPGPEGIWKTRRDAIIASLVELLSCVHAAGIFHGDLKPQNVLVDGDGRVTLLDFGTGSWVAGLSSEHQLARAHGTPAYMAPEQLRGQPATAYSDYYALGVMLYEVLVGKLPHPAGSLLDLVRARLDKRPPSIDAEAAGISARLARAVEGLLSPAAERRAQFLGDLLEALDPEHSVALTPQQPAYLDPRGVVEQAVAALERGESVDIVGRRGMGRSRYLEELARRLRQRGHRVNSLIAATEAYKSLMPLAGRDAEVDGDTPQAAREFYAALVRRTLDSGKILLVDNFEKIDEATRRLLCEERERGGVVFARREPVDGAIELQPLSVEQLEGLFDGPEPLFRLRSEAARQLWLRTGGVPRSIARQIGLWVRHGLAHFREERIVVPPQQLERLRRGLRFQPAVSPMAVLDGDIDLAELAAWCQLAGPNATPEHLAPLLGQPVEKIRARVDELIERGVAVRAPDATIVTTIDALATSPYSDDEIEQMHRRLADALCQGAPGRLLHLLHVGRDAEVVAEARAAAARHDTRGETGLAIAALSEAVNVSREADDAYATRDLLVDWAKMALSTEETPRIEELLYAIERAFDRKVPDLDQLHQLVDAARIACQRGDREVLEMLDALEPFDDWELELRRQMYRLRAAMRCSRELFSTVLDDIEAWVDTGQPGREARGSLIGWKGMRAYYRGEFLEASELHLDAARIKDRPSAKLSSIISAVTALMDGLDYDAALQHARAALARAEKLHRHRDQAYCHYLLRSLRYRLGEPLEPGDELREALGILGAPNLSAVIYMVDAADAFRRGERANAAELAREARSNYERTGNRRGEALMRALVLRCTDDVDPAEAHELVAFARQCSAPRIGVQIVGLLLGADIPARPEWGDALAELAATVAEADHHKRLEVLSVEEALGGADVPRRI